MIFFPIERTGLSLIAAARFIRRYRGQKLEKTIHKIFYSQMYMLLFVNANVIMYTRDTPQYSMRTP